MSPIFEYNFRRLFMIKYKVILIYSLLLCIIASVSVYAEDTIYNKNNTSLTFLGKTDSDLLGGEIEGISVCRIGETNLGNLVADALCDAAEQILRHSDYADLPIVAIQNGGGIRKTIPTGNIFKKQLTEVFPYKNFLTISVITPKLLYETLENGVSRITVDQSGTLFCTDGRFPQVAGMRFIYDPTQTPANTFSVPTVEGNRILSIFLKDSNISLNKNDNETKIILACNNYCMDGSDGYTMLKNSSILYESEPLEDIVAKYITKLSTENNGSFLYNTDNRITVGEELGKYQSHIKVLLKGESVSCDVAPIIESNKVLIPMRPVFEKLGAEVLWNADTRCISININNKIIYLNPDLRKIQIENQLLNWPMPLKIINGRTMVSIPFLRQTLGMSVSWDSQYNTVFITE